MRPVRTALRAIGKVRKRLMTPVLRSDATPTAVPMLAVVRFIVTRPPIANAL